MVLSKTHTLYTSSWHGPIQKHPLYMVRSQNTPYTLGKPVDFCYKVHLPSSCRFLGLGVKASEGTVFWAHLTCCSLHEGVRWEHLKLSIRTRWNCPWVLSPLWPQTSTRGNRPGLARDWVQFWIGPVLGQQLRRGQPRMSWDSLESQGLVPPLHQKAIIYCNFVPSPGLGILPCACVLRACECVSMCL